MKTISSTQAVETFSGKTGAGKLTRFAEGSTIPKKNRYKLYDTAFDMDQYGGQIEVTRKQLMNREFSDKFDEFKDLTIGGNVTRSQAPAMIFNGAFTNSGIFELGGIRVTTYNDGRRLASTAHPRVDGGTSQSNASSTGITLTDDNLETGRVALLQQLQDDGTPITVTGDLYLVVPTALEKKSTIITQSTQRSGTANNDVNIYSGGYIKVMASNWLGASQTGGSDTRWFLVAPSIAKLYFILRSDMDMDQTVDKSTKSTLFDVILDFAVGSADWHGVWGSAGDGLAYSS